MILADTSIWIDHLRARNPLMDQLVSDAGLFMHPFVLGELALGSLNQRQALLHEWGKLPLLAVQRHNLVMALIERRRLFSRGIDYTDANLLASTLARPGTRLWTRDRRLAAMAAELDVSAAPGR